MKQLNLLAEGVVKTVASPEAISRFKEMAHSETEDTNYLRENVNWTKVKQLGESCRDKVSACNDMFERLRRVEVDKMNDERILDVQLDK